MLLLKLHQKSISLLLLLVISIFCYKALASTPSSNITVLANTKSQLHQNYINTLLKKTKQHLEIKDYQQKLATDSKFIITVGNIACQKAIATYKKKYILCTLLPSFEFSRLAQGINKKNLIVGAIYIDQPYSRRLNFIKEYFPAVKRVAIIKSDNNPISHTVDHNDKILINTYTVENFQEILRLLSHINDNNDAILATEDKLVYNNKTIRRILLLSYRKEMPIIAFSKNFVKAGAAASIYSTIDDLTQEVNEIINSYTNNTNYRLEAKHPKYYTTSFNEEVIQALAIPTSKRADRE